MHKLEDESPKMDLDSECLKRYSDGSDVIVFDEDSTEGITLISAGRAIAELLNRGDVYIMTNYSSDYERPYMCRLSEVPENVKSLCSKKGLMGDEEHLYIEPDAEINTASAEDIQAQTDDIGKNISEVNTTNDNPLNKIKSKGILGMLGELKGLFVDFVREDTN